MKSFWVSVQAIGLYAGRISNLLSCDIGALLFLKFNDSFCQVEVLNKFLQSPLLKRAMGLKDIPNGQTIRSSSQEGESCRLLTQSYRPSKRKGTHTRWLILLSRSQPCLPRDVYVFCSPDDLQGGWHLQRTRGNSHTIADLQGNIIFM